MQNAIQLKILIQFVIPFFITFFFYIYRLNYKNSGGFLNFISLKKDANSEPDNTNVILFYYIIKISRLIQNL